MSSSRNAPEWFGGGSSPSKRRSPVPNGGSGSSHKRSSSASSSRRSGSKSRQGQAFGDLPSGSKSDRRKKHKRKKSREVVNMAEILDKAQDHNQNSMARVAPLETSRKGSSKLKSGSNGNASEGSKSSSPSPATTPPPPPVLTPKRSKMPRKPSFVERLLGLKAPSSDDKGKKEKNKKDKKLKKPSTQEVEELDRSNSSSGNRNCEGDQKLKSDPPGIKADPPGILKRSASDGSIQSDPSTSPSRRRSQSSTRKSPLRHRRTRSDPVDISQISMLSPYRYQNSRQAASYFEERYQSTPSSASFDYAPTVPLSSSVPASAFTSHHYSTRSAPGSHNHVDYSGAESDDPLVYSEDESTTANHVRFYPVQSKTSRTSNNDLYPYYGYHDAHNNQESQHLMEHQRMMALAPNRQVASLAKPSSHFAHAQAHKPRSHHYGSISHMPLADQLRRSSTPPGNEFYISEDETCHSVSDSSKSGKGPSVGNFKDYKSSRDQLLTSEDQAIMEEDEDLNFSNESTALLSPIKAEIHSVNSGQSDNNNSNGGSSNSGSGNRSRKSVKIASPPALSIESSNSTGSGSRMKHKPQHSPNPMRESPPPPIKSVSIQHSRTVSNGTATTASNSVYNSPHSALRMQAPSSQPQTQRLSRKERKRLLRRLDVAELKEDKIQSIIRSGHFDALDWSQHVTQQVRGRNHAAGFFPQEESKTHDLPFAFLFLLQMSFIVYLAVAFFSETILIEEKISTYENMDKQSPFDFSDMYNDPFSTSSNPGSNMFSKYTDIHVDYANAIQLACIVALYATSLSALFLGMMMILSKALIPTVLCLFVIVCIAFGTIGVALNPYSFVPVVGIIALAVSLGYSIVVWDRIPFAATNLDAALCGIKSSADVLIVGFLMMITAFLWTIGWGIAFLGVYDHYLDKFRTVSWTELSVSIGMIVSYFWTMNVFKNITHVTIAGVVATWWADPESLTSCCNSVLREQFALSLTSSFGSICLGSLIVPPLELAKSIYGMCYLNCDSPSSSALSSADTIGVSKIGDLSVHSDPSNLALLPVTNSPLDGAIKYFNDYGFTYVGIYRERFTTSSRKATEVFETREWIGVVNDKLIPTVLNLIAAAITLGSGCFGLVVEEFDGYRFTNVKKPTSTAFIIGCTIGLVVSTMCLKVVGSSVSTILVCFSLAPWKFHMNHPGLSKEMRSSWGGVWLDEYDWLERIERGDERQDGLQRI